MVLFLFWCSQWNGDEQVGTPRDFNECVSRDQLQPALDCAQQGMNEAIKKVVTEALIGLNIGNNMERLDKRISTLTEKVAELETRIPTNENRGFHNEGQFPEDTVKLLHAQQDYDDAISIIGQVWVVLISTNIR